MKKNDDIIYNIKLIFKSLFYSDFHLLMIYSFYGNLVLSIYFYLKINKLLSYFCFILSIYQYILCIHYDERYKKIYKKHHLISQCFDSLPSLFLIFDEEGNMIFANDLFESFSIGKKINTFENLLEFFQENTNLYETLKKGRSILEKENFFCQNISIDHNKYWKFYLGYVKKTQKSFFVCYISEVLENVYENKKKNQIYNFLNDLEEGILIYDFQEIIYMNNSLKSFLKTSEINIEDILNDIKYYQKDQFFFSTYSVNDNKILLKFEKIKDEEYLYYKIYFSNIIQQICFLKIPIGIALLDEEYNIVETNNNFNTLLNSFFINKKNFLSYISKSDTELFINYLKNKKIRNINAINLNLIDKNDELLKCHGEYISNGLWLIFLENNNLQKDFEIQMRHSQRLGLLGQVLSAASHDFNNILTVINGFLDIFSKKIDIHDSKYADLIQIKHNLARAIKLVQHILTLSKKNIKLEEKETKAHEIISNLLDSMGRLFGEKIRVIFEKNEEEIFIKMHPINFEQIVLNLLVNARDAMPNGGDIVVSLKIINIKKLQLDNFILNENENYMELSVKDTGEGISEQNKKKIFDSFFTTKKDGTGLGLATVKAIIHQNQGHIEIYSKLKFGTTFKVYLPIESNKSTENFFTPSVKIPLDKEINIILLEDDISLTTLLIEALKFKKNFIIENFNSSKNTLSFLEKNKKEIHLIIADLIISDGHSLTIISHIKKIFPNIKIIIISGYDQNYLKEHPEYNLLDSTNIVFLGKPFTIENILEIIDNFFFI